MSLVTMTSRKTLFFNKRQRQLVQQRPLTERRLQSFKTASDVAQECGCPYCKTATAALWDALADHGELG